MWMAYIYRCRAAMVAALLAERNATMANLQQMLNAFIAAETETEVQHGSQIEVAKAELEALGRLKRSVDSMIKAYREMAVEDGMAEFKQVWTTEHVVKGHFKNRFTWVD